MSDFKNHKWYRFWLTLHNGLSVHTHKFLLFCELEYALGRWCSQYRPFYPDDCEYGYTELKSAPPAVLIQKIKIIEIRMKQDQARMAEYVKQTTVQDY